MYLKSSSSFFVATTPQKIQPIIPKTNINYDAVFSVAYNNNNSNSKTNTPRGGRSRSSSRSQSPISVSPSQINAPLSPVINSQSTLVHTSTEILQTNNNTRTIQHSTINNNNVARQQRRRSIDDGPTSPILKLLIKSNCLDYVNLMIFSISCKSAYNIISNDENNGDGKLKMQCLYRYGISSSTCRFSFWCHVLDIKKIEQRHQEQMIEENNNNSTATYEILRGDRNVPFVLDENGWEGTIKRDLPRTFPYHPYFQSDLGKHSLGRILRAIVLLLPDVSYCQGMNYVVAVLLLCALNNGNGNLDEWNPSSLDLIENYFETNDEYCDEIIEIEKKVFWIMIGLIKHRELKGIWSPGIKALKLRTVQFYKLLDKKMPLYRKYFNQLNIDGFFFTSQWYLTIFSYVLIHDIDLLCIVWDCFFKYGWNVLFSFSLLVIDTFDKDIVFNMDIEAFTKYFRELKGDVKHHNNNDDDENKSNGSGNFMKRLKDAVKNGLLFQFKIEEQELEILQRQYEEGLINVHIRSTPIKKSIYARSLLAQVEGPARVDSKKLREKIEKAHIDIQHHTKLFKKSGRALVTHRAELEDLLDIKGILKQQLSTFLLEEEEYNNSKEDGDLRLPKTPVKALMKKIENGQKRLDQAILKHRKAIWKHTFNTANLEESIYRKNHFSYQLNEIVGMNERRRSDTIKNMCEALNLS